MPLHILDDLEKYMHGLIGKHELTKAFRKQRLLKSSSR
jgi:hypothetical protein